MLASMTNGVIINATDGIVTLRRLNINGAGNGINGVRIIAAKKVIMDDCVIVNFTGKGIEANTACSVILNNVTIQNTEDAVFLNNDGCMLAADNCRFQASKNAGLNVSAGKAAVNACNISDGAVAIMSSPGTTVMLSGNFISGNATVSQSKGTVNSVNNNVLAGNGTAGSPFSSIKMQ
jgi:hypothetical protein